MSENAMDLKIEITTRGPESLVSEGGVQGRVVWALGGGEGTPELLGLGDGERQAVQDRLEETSFRPVPGKVQELHLRDIEGPVYVAGLGEADDLDAGGLRRAAGAVEGAVRRAGLQELGLPLPGRMEAREEARVVAEGLALASYRFTSYLSEEEASRRRSGALQRLLVAVGDGGQDEARAGVDRGLLTARGISYARDLVNTPSQDKRPAELAERASALAGGTITATVFEEDRIREEGMGALLGVAQGSEAPARFIHLHYRPEGEAKRKLALVGKGVTFDSGGLSLKPPKGMEDMKVDMAGSAAVLGVFAVLAELAPPVEVHGIVAAAENMPSGTAIRPGDVLRSMRGKTIEVLNTDAEGRLTLADALTFACRQGVDEIIDLATLTGACVVALGEATGLWGRPEDFRDRVWDASKAAGERTWPMPLVDDYREKLRSPVADIKNVAGRGAGAITAALFLRDFVDEEVAWCHMDIAGSASTDKDLAWCPQGATGTGVGTLIRYIESL